MITALRDIVTVLADADPADKASLYDELGITLSYRPNGTVNVQALPRGVEVRVGGPSRTLGTRSIPRSEVLLLGSGDGLANRISRLADRPGGK
jgi:hypothetical protein